MPSTYTTNLGLEKPATGEQAGVWGDTANNDYDFIDQATDGSLTVALSSSSFNLNTQQGAASQGRSKIIVFTGTLTQNATVNITPNTGQKIYYVTNATVGGFNVIFQQGTGAVFTLQPGYSAMIFTDGLGNAASVNGAIYNGQFGSLLITGALTVNGASNFTQAITFTQAATFSGAVTMNGTTTVTGLVINAGGVPGAAYDIYYRAPTTGIATPLPIGTPGQLLQVNGSGALSWASVGLSLGSGISGSSPLAVFYSTPANVLGQDTSFTWNPGLGLGIGLVAGHPLHVGGVVQPQLWLDASAPATQTRQVVWAAGNLARWALVSPPGAETGGNVGSNLGLLSYADSGTALGLAMSFFRSNNHVSVGTSSDGGAQLFVQNGAPGQPALVVEAAAGQSQPVQIWKDSTGATLASIDQNGVLFTKGSQGNVTLNAQGRMNLWGTASGSPLGTIQVGVEPGAGPLTLGSSIAFQGAVGGPDPMPPGVARIYFRATPTPTFVIQFYYNGTQYYATLPLLANSGSAVNWFISPNPV